MSYGESKFTGKLRARARVEAGASELNLDYLDSHSKYLPGPKKEARSFQKKREKESKRQMDVGRLLPGVARRFGFHAKTDLVIAGRKLKELKKP